MRIAREVVEAQGRAWQRLDGQQRLNALDTILTNDSAKHEWPLHRVDQSSQVHRES